MYFIRSDEAGSTQIAHGNHLEAAVDLVVLVPRPPSPELSPPLVVRQPAVVPIRRLAGPE